MYSSAQIINNTTRMITTWVGCMLAFAGFEHGLFEILHGYEPTEGLIIQAISDEMMWWKYGGEEAFSIIPNYFITGIVAVLVSLTIMFWSVKYITRRLGPTIFLILFIVLTLVGGGIGFTPFYLMTWAFATRINKPLNWWKKVLKPGTRKVLSGLWKYTLGVVVVAWIIALEIAIFGYFPGASDPEVLLAICWSMLGVSFVFIVASYVSAFASDIEKQTN